MSARPPPLGLGNLGDTNLFGFVVTVNFSRDGDCGAGGEGCPEDHIPPEIRDRDMTITHEGMHFLHAMSTGYLYRLAVRLWQEVRNARKIARGLPQRPITLPLPGLDQLSRMFAALPVKSDLLTAPEIGISGISPLDVIEGAAVFAAYRMHLRGIDHDSLMQRLRARYGAGASPYCDALRLGDHYLGEDIFELFLPLCFLVLCSAEPGAVYCRMIRALGTSGFLRDNNRPSFRQLAELAAAYGMRELRTAPEEIEIVGKHPILAPYIMQFLAQHPDLDFVEFAARPHEAGDSAMFTYLLPPLIRYNDGTAMLSPRLPNLLGLPTGIAHEAWVRKHTNFVVHLTAICGAALGMAEPADYYMQCPHEDCPHYPLRLCHGFAPIPPTYRDCGFPDTFRDTFVPLAAIARP